MNSIAIKVILQQKIEKACHSMAALEASVGKVLPFDALKEYSFDELEPYDALCDRFVRTVEVFFKLFRTFQLYHEGMNSDTLRDLLLYCEKQGLITNVDVWFDMREVRNRIVHDYLPEQQKQLIEDITNEFIEELRFAYYFIIQKK